MHNPICQRLEEKHGRGRIEEIGASHIVSLPVGGSDIFNNIDSSDFESREQDVERFDYLRREMATIVDNDINCRRSDWQRGTESLDRLGFPGR